MNNQILRDAPTGSIWETVDHGLVAIKEKFSSHVRVQTLNDYSFEWNVDYDGKYQTGLLVEARHPDGRDILVQKGSVTPSP